MIKTAIIVEGVTEQVFVTELLKHLAHSLEYEISSIRHGGGRRSPVYEMKIDNIKTAENPDYYFLIVDASGDGRVLPYVLDQYDSLISSDYQNIIALRDLYPGKIDALERLRNNATKLLKTNPIEVLFIFAIMEVEAWIIAESTHFARLDPTLTADRILNELGLDLAATTEGISHPAKTLDDVYQLVGRCWDKSRGTTQSIVQILDFDQVPVSAGNKAPTMLQLYQELSRILGARARKPEKKLRLLRWLLQKVRAAFSGQVH